MFDGVARGLAPLRNRAGERYERWVRIGIGGAFLGYAVVLGITAVFDSREPGAYLALGVTTVFLAVAYVSALRGRTNVAALVASVAIWIEVHVGIASIGAVLSPSIIVLPGLVLGVGFLVGGRAALVLATASLVSAPLAAEIGHRTGFGPGPGIFNPDAFNFLATYWAVVFTTALLVNLGLHTLSTVLDEADHARKRFEDLFQQAPEGVLVLDAEHRVVAANPSALSLLGRSPPPEGRHLSQLLPRLDLRAFEANAALEPSELGTPQTVLFEGGDGVSRVLEIGGRRVKRSDGASETQVMVRDVTERLASQERATQLGRILDQAGNEILIFARGDGRIRSISRGARENLGIGPRETVRETILELAPSLVVEGLADLSRALERRRGRPLRRETVFRRRDGTVYPAESELLASVLDGEPVVVAFSVDISQRVRAEEEQQRLQRSLEEAQRLEAVGILAGGVAHDFNNLLTIIGGAAEVLLEDAEGEARELLSEITTAQERGAELTGQLLAFARRETRRPQSVRLVEIVAGAEPLLRRMAGPARTFTVETEDAPRVLVDPGQLEQVLMNLVANARDACGEGGHISVRLTSRTGSEDGRWAVLEVHDDGAGMDAETRARIFEPFFTTKPRGKGTGLGLAAVHGIVSQGGGHIEVDSAPGRGTVFRLEFPAIEHRDEARAAPSTLAGGDVGAQRILLVEDDDGARKIIAATLEARGHAVTSAASAEEALELFHDPGAFDLLVSDVLMPGRSGIELAQSLRKRGLRHPVLLISGYLGQHLEDGVARADRMDLLMKPFTGAALLERVDALARSGLPRG